MIKSGASKLTRLSWSTLGIVTVGKLRGVVRSFPEICYQNGELVSSDGDLADGKWKMD